MTLFHLARSDSNASLFANFLFPQQGEACPFIDVNERDDLLSNVTPLHIAATYNCKEIVGLMIRHAKVLDGDGSNARLRKLLTCRDLESGYTALHRALLARNVQLAWFIMSSSHLIIRWEDCVDHEGYSPLDMLSQTLRDGLRECRQNIYNKISSMKNFTGRDRSESLAEIFEHDYDEVSTGSDENVRSRSACELMAYGRANNFALGIPKFSKGNEQDLSSNRPRRVPSFAIGDARFVYNSGTVIAIASAAHHSLILTEKGHLYTCGYGKGGRLGIGNDKDQPTPLRIMGAFEKRKVISISAAENHSLACTQEGKVYAWGSNRFGQLGCTTGCGGSLSSTIRSLPRKIEDLKKYFVVKVAAGSRHSVSLTRDGQVLTWGDNSLGQLGVNGSCGNGKIHSVSYLWNSESVKVAFDITAGDQSTLVLTKPNNGTGVNNSLYEWGHGVSHPAKVIFPSPKYTSGKLAAYSTNPVAMSSGKHHNVALSEDGRVYSWGFHSESLGTNKLSGTMSTCKNMGSPKLISSLSSEFVVSISATDDHTAVVTDAGDLFTFGSSTKDILGHEGVKFQPSPKKVAGVKRVISVAAAREHTMLLIGTTFPTSKSSIDNDSLRIEERRDSKRAPMFSLQKLCFHQITKHIDIFNASNLFSMSEYIYCHELAGYCMDFIRLNLDGVLSLNKRKDLDQLSSYIASTNSTNEKARLIGQTSRDVAEDHQQSLMITRCKRLVSSFSTDSCDPNSLESKQRIVAKELRGLRKKLNNCLELEKRGQSLSADQLQKLSRRSMFEECIGMLEPIITVIESKMQHFNLSSTAKRLIPVEDAFIQNSNEELLKKGIETKTDEDTQTNSLRSIYRCDVCNICCPDQSSLAFHISGKKHRNRLNKIEEDDRAATLKSLECNRQSAHYKWSSTPEKVTIISDDSCSGVKAPSFQDILNEEAKSQLPVTVKRTPKQERRQRQSNRNPASKAIWTNTSPIFSIKQSTSSPCKTRKSDSDSPWTKRKERAQEYASNTAQQKLRDEHQSFQDILREEEQRKSTNDTRGLTSSKWFLEQRDRAGSFAAILEQEAEMERMIEEQRMIEAQIRASLEIGKTKDKSSDNKNGRSKGSNNQRTNANGYSKKNDSKKNGFSTKKKHRNEKKGHSLCTNS